MLTIFIRKILMLSNDMHRIIMLKCPKSKCLKVSWVQNKQKFQKLEIIWSDVFLFNIFSKTI